MKKGREGGRRKGEGRRKGREGKEEGEGGEGGKARVPPLFEILNTLLIHTDRRR